MQDILLTDLIDVQMLQRIQNGFSQFTGMATLTTDAEGNPVTEGSGFTDFCMEYTRKTPKGFERCKECDKRGGLLTLKQGKSVVYNCHAGLVDYAAPIMVEGQYIGSFIGGQVRTGPIVEEQVRATARELGIDEDAYLEAIRRTNRISYEQVEQAADFLTEIAEVLSEVAYKSYLALQQSHRLERAALSHHDFIAEMNTTMRQKVLEWMDNAQNLSEEFEDTKEKELLENLSQIGQELIASIDDTVECSQLVSGEEVELKESQYDIRDLMKSIQRSCKGEVAKRGNEMVLKFSRELPSVLLGDAGRIRQIVLRFVQSCNRRTKNGVITIYVHCSKKSYATQTIIEISDTSRGMSAEELKVMQDIFAGWSAQEDIVGSTVIPMLLAKMSGTIEIDSVIGQGTVYKVSVPQLALPESEK